MLPVRTITHCATIVAARIAATLIVRAWGLRALSDDDFSRITIAQSFAIHPRIDPTGTSWLPVPFWIQGAVMALFGRSLLVADLVTAAGACFGALLLYGAARWSGLSARASLAAAIAAAVLPVAAVTGAANVPELPVACCTAAALILLRDRTAARCFAAAALLLPATLSRYEPWPAALAASAILLIPSKRVALHKRIASALIAVSGPVLWIAWNAHAHGDPFHFHARVSAYRTALGATAALGSYPLSLAIELIPVVMVAVAGAVLMRSRPHPSPLPPPREREPELSEPRSERETIRPGALAGNTPAGAIGKRNLVNETQEVSLPVQRASWSGPLAACAFILVALVAAEARGGAPTHHPERAVLAITFVAWFASIDLIDRATVRWRPSLWVAASVALLVIVSGVRLHSMLPSYGVDRSAEIEAGRWIAAHVPPADRVVIEPSDYGYFAIMAASGRPEMVSVTRSLDPRRKDEPAVIPPDAKWIVTRHDDGWRVQEWRVQEK